MIVALPPKVNLSGRETNGTANEAVAAKAGGCAGMKSAALRLEWSSAGSHREAVLRADARVVRSLDAMGTASRTHFCWPFCQGRLQFRVRT